MDTLRGGTSGERGGDVVADDARAGAPGDDDG